MLTRAYYLLIAIVAVGVVLSAGWLDPLKLGGVAVLALAAGLAIAALRP